MGKITSIIGLVLIVAAGIVASVSTSYEKELENKKKLCKKYVNSAKEALKKQNYGDAKKFIQNALKVDPQNKAAIKTLMEISLAQNPVSAAPAQNSAQTQNNSNNQAKPQQATPSKEESEDDLGC